MSQVVLTSQQKEIFHKLLESVIPDVPSDFHEYIVSKLNGTDKNQSYLEWSGALARVKASTEKPKGEHPAATATVKVGAKNGMLYEGTVSVQESYSKQIFVVAKSDKQAQQLMLEAAVEQYPHGFELDEGNVKHLADFYLPDAEGFKNHANIETTSEHNFSGEASWADAGYAYSVRIFRDEPDNSDDDARASTTVLIAVTDIKGFEVRTTLAEYQIYDDNLGDWLDDALEGDTFEEEIEELKTKLVAMTTVR